MNGPQCFSEAERLLAAANEYEAEGDLEMAGQRRSEAQTRALLALTASHAASTHPQSTSWDHAINGQEQP
ncbi:hypothetical protein [Streptomyces sp. 351MFTsu5.1]|uniref:hypothetical protein n=1 Tax=Streptomyces sp. 351MFTsu5.1 TaxID=1172180 RepID=UPI00035F0129|nr:hypothetical protein [Streptomyces sp. 351MFTsu5.1]